MSDVNCSFDRFLIYEPPTTVRPAKLDRNKRSPIGTQQANVDLRRFLIGNQVIRASKTSDQLTDDNRNDNRKSIKEQRKDKPLKSVDLLTRTLEKDKPAQIVCGKKEPNSKYVSKGSKLILRFVTDDFGEYLGFSIGYKFLTKDEAKQLNEQQKQANDEDKEEKKDSIEYDIEPTDADVTIGSSYIIRCRPKGYSKLNLINDQIIKWFKDEKELTTDLNEDKTELLIREFQVSSIGNYKCRFGKSSRQAWLKAKNNTQCHNNEILFQRRPQDIVTTVGEYPILECVAVAINSNSLHSKLKITWLHNEQPIRFDAPDKHAQLLPNNYLLLSEIRKEDAGYYYCRAELDSNNAAKSHDDCQKTAIAFVQVRSKQNVENFCGKPVRKGKTQQSSQNEFGKIVGGTEAIRGQHPWQVYIIIRKIIHSTYAFFI